MHVVKRIEGRKFYWNNEDGTWDSAPTRRLSAASTRRLSAALNESEGGGVEIVSTMRDALKEHGITHAAVARRAGCSTRTVARQLVAIPPSAAVMAAARGLIDEATAAAAEAAAVNAVCAEVAGATPPGVTFTGTMLNIKREWRWRVYATVRREKGTTTTERKGSDKVRARARVAMFAAMGTAFAEGE